jgi:hypothetical protein
MKNNSGRRIAIVSILLLSALLGACSGGDTSAGDKSLTAVAGDAGISFTLEGCRNNGDVTLPNGNGDFICPDAAYTPGNLGKGWNELDLVPYRLTVTAGNSAGALQTFVAGVALDNFDAGRPGYDVLSAPVLNTALSSASCAAASVDAQTPLLPGLGGIDTTIYRLLTFVQAQNTECVYDFYGRLALGSHLFPGSSLHANAITAQLDTGGIGARDVSIPVNEIDPQEISKSMGASQGSDHAWTVSKEGPASVSFGDVCTADNRQDRGVQITVKWEKLAAVAGEITAIATITATNPASRTITVQVTDELYLGSDQSVLLHTTVLDPVDVPANTTMTVGTDVVTLPATTAAIGDWLNDVARASYIDQVTGIPVPGQTTAGATAQVTLGTVTNASADVTDTESMTGAGLSFAAATPGVGGFTNYLGGYTVGPVDWASGTQAGTGSVTFDKTVALGAPWLTSGTLSDQARLLASNGGTADSGVFSVGISSGATVAMTIRKTIPPDFLIEGDTATVTFHVTNGDATYANDVTVTLDAAHGSAETTLSGLQPGIYTVQETGIAYSQAGFYPTLLPAGGDTATVDLSVPSNGPDPFSNCAGSAQFDNDIPSGALDRARVQKTTYPAQASGDAGYTWSFTLSGPGGVNETVTAGAGAGYVEFATELLRPGTYTVSEAGKADWDPTSPSGNCTFTVAYPSAAGQMHSCDFVNTQRAHANVVKTVSGGALTGSYAFKFELRTGATAYVVGTTLETQVASAANGGSVGFATGLVPGQTYQMCEWIGPAWLTTLGNFVPNNFMPPDGTALNPAVDNSILCGDFVAQPGETVTFTVDNTPPPGGRALTIGYWKNHASCRKSHGGQDPVLDQILATFPVVSPNSRPGVYFGSLYVDTCAEAVALLDKATLAGKKLAADPAFNMAAQLMATNLNLRAGAGSCTGVATAVNQAHALLVKYSFNGLTHGKISAADTAAMNSLATTLDRYNNNLFCS